jgi:glutamate 5-kinase
LESRKKWILAGKMPAGHVTIDEGAVRALLAQGKSLLPAGITDIVGNFERGDTITIQKQDGHVIGRGVVRYASSDLNRIAGRRSEEIAGILGYDHGAAVVHRNDLILL